MTSHSEAIYLDENALSVDVVAPRVSNRGAMRDNSRIVGNPYLIALRQRLPVTREESLKVPGVTTTMGCE